MIYILVFWLATPDNFAEYTKYKTEYECNQNVQAWNQRLQKVNSKLIAECRFEQTKSLQTETKTVK